MVTEEACERRRERVALEEREVVSPKCLWMDAGNHQSPVTDLLWALGLARALAFAHRNDVYSDSLARWRCVLMAPLGVMADAIDVIVWFGFASNALCNVWDAGFSTGPASDRIAGKKPMYPANACAASARSLAALRRHLSLSRPISGDDALGVSGSCAPSSLLQLGPALTDNHP